MDQRQHQGGPVGQHGQAAGQPVDAHADHARLHPAHGRLQHQQGDRAAEPQQGQHPAAAGAAEGLDQTQGRRGQPGAHDHGEANDQMSEMAEAVHGGVPFSSVTVNPKSAGSTQQSAVLFQIGDVKARGGQHGAVGPDDPHLVGALFTVWRDQLRQRRPDPTGSTWRATSTPSRVQTCSMKPAGTPAISLQATTVSPAT